MINVDKVLELSLEAVYPNHRRPDEQNYISGHRQYKAPDHEVASGKILIERKSRNAKDDSQFYEKLKSIAKSQGCNIVALGLFNLDDAFKLLPDPESARREILNYTMNQMFKRLREAQRKFSDYMKFNDDNNQLKLVIISDLSEIYSSTAGFVHRFGEKMGARRQSDDAFPLIDGIIFIKDPRYVLERENSFWFNFLIRERVYQNKKELIKEFFESIRFDSENRLKSIGYENEFSGKFIGIIRV